MNNNRITADFIIIGAAKSGTTSLFNYLVKHPKVSRPRNKEIHYFDREIRNRDLSWYNKQINRKPGTLGFEATPSYLLDPHSAELLAEVTKDIKLIACLRNPIDRAYSWYTKGYHKMGNLTKANGSPSFEEVLKTEKHVMDKHWDAFAKSRNYDNEWFFEFQIYWSFMRRGFYDEQIKRYYNFFPKKQILILCAEDFFHSPQRTVNLICQFLNIQKIKIGPIRKFNATKYRKAISPKTKDYLADVFKPHNERLFKLLGRRFDWD